MRRDNPVAAELRRQFPTLGSGRSCPQVSGSATAGTEMVMAAYFVVEFDAEELSDLGRPRI
jgi:hypothetical protein